MSRAVRGIDHAVIVVQDIDAAETAYRRLGFAVRPRGFHTSLGTANHLVMFGNDYFELLGVVQANDFNAERRALLAAKGGGLANLAVATDGADLVHAAWREAGLAPDAPLAFGRDVEIAGRTEHARFRTVRVPKPHYPVVGLFACDHLTPGFVYRPEWSQHDNGAVALAGAVVVCDAPAGQSTLLAKFFGTGAVQATADGLSVGTGTIPLEYMTRDVFARRHDGLVPARSDDHPALLAFRVTSLDRCAARLGQGGVAFRRSAGRLLVAAGEAAGVALAFQEG